MVKSILCCLALFAICFSSSNLWAKSNGNNSDFSFFAGTAQGLGWPKTYRLLWKELELGTFPTSVGMVKVFPIGNLYADFGVGVSQQGVTQAGFLAGVGYQYYLGWAVGLRADWSTFGGVGGYSNTDVSLGITLNF